MCNKGAAPKNNKHKQPKEGRSTKEEKNYRNARVSHGDRNSATVSTGRAAEEEVPRGHTAASGTPERNTGVRAGRKGSTTNFCTTMEPGWAPTQWQVL